MYRDLSIFTNENRPEDVTLHQVVDSDESGVPMDCSEIRLMSGSVEKIFSNEEPTKQS